MQVALEFDGDAMDLLCRLLVACGLWLVASPSSITIHSTRSVQDLCQQKTQKL